MARSGIIAWLALILVVVAGALAPSASAAAPTFERIKVDDTFPDEFLTEACDVPVRWSCRTGVCRSCESGLLDGEVDYAPEPLEPPAAGRALLCCSRPRGQVTLDL